MGTWEVAGSEGECSRTWELDEEYKWINEIILFTNRRNGYRKYPHPGASYTVKYNNSQNPLEIDR